MSELSPQNDQPQIYSPVTLGIRSYFRCLITFFDFTRNNGRVHGYNDLGAENYELVKPCTKGSKFVFEHVQNRPRNPHNASVQRCMERVRNKVKICPMVYEMYGDQITVAHCYRKYGQYGDVLKRRANSL